MEVLSSGLGHRRKTDPVPGNDYVQEDQLPEAEETALVDLVGWARLGRYAGDGAFPREGRRGFGRGGDRREVSHATASSVAGGELMFGGFRV